MMQQQQRRRRLLLCGPAVILLFVALLAGMGNPEFIRCPPGTVTSGGTCVESVAFIVGGQGGNFQWSGASEVYGLDEDVEVADFPTSMDTPVMTW